ncbi:hypothetical protein CEXT_706881 [Caerostris extrusa]|uniref:Uncharacterized protein n=1 Tax=Caerostris extrusa TaxID=172846 RepID=A0AAV4PXD5_CAEEX|nr:hypothetical protein CEXT_706881 [Caerostris extrusa]
MGAKINTLADFLEMSLDMDGRSISSVGVWREILAYLIATGGKDSMCLGMVLRKLLNNNLQKFALEERKPPPSHISFYKAANSQSAVNKKRSDSVHTNS